MEKREKRDMEKRLESIDKEEYVTYTIKYTI